MGIDLLKFYQVWEFTQNIGGSPSGVTLQSVTNFTKRYKVYTFWDGVNLYRTFTLTPINLNSIVTVIGVLSLFWPILS